MTTTAASLGLRVLARLDLASGPEPLLLLCVPTNAASEAPAGLTPAEHAVASLALGGASNARIARERGSSVRTIATQLASVFRKLRVASRSELALALLALEHAAQKPVRVSGNPPPALPLPN